jgi:hypothetical protein
MFGDLPPSSRVTRFTVAAAFAAINFPTSVEPYRIENKLQNKK